MHWNVHCFSNTSITKQILYVKNTQILNTFVRTTWDRNMETWGKQDKYMETYSLYLWLPYIRYDYNFTQSSTIPNDILVDIVLYSCIISLNVTHSIEKAFYNQAHCKWSQNCDKEFDDKPETDPNSLKDFQLTCSSVCKMAQILKCIHKSVASNRCCRKHVTIKSDDDKMLQILFKLNYKKTVRQVTRNRLSSLKKEVSLKINNSRVHERGFLFCLKKQP